MSDLIKTQAESSPLKSHGLRLYIARRLLQSLFVFFIVVTVIFVISRMAADPVATLLPPGATPIDRENLRQSLGLDKSLIDQYVIYLNNLIHGDFGISTLYNVPVLPLVLNRCVPTFALALFAILWASVLAIFLGVLASLRPGSIFDRILGGIVSIAQGTASFWLAVVLLYIFSVKFRIFPVTGNSEGLKSFVLPGISLGLAPFVAILRLTRSSMIETLKTGYIRNANSRGLKTTRVVINHAMRNIAEPILSYAGILFGGLASGAVITETIFAWPGIGQLSMQGISLGDYALVQAVTMLASLTVILLNLIVDLINLKLNPVAREKVKQYGKL
ncbi:MAG: ABC transporter permease [Actinomycetes bacterium]